MAAALAWKSAERALSWVCSWGMAVSGALVGAMGGADAAWCAQRRPNVRQTGDKSCHFW
jgi:hypothetical protein